MNILIFSCSLSASSRSRILAAETAEILRRSGASGSVIDLRDHPLPLCDGEDVDERLVAPLRKAIQAADAIIVAVPIYNYDVNAAAKNLIEITGSDWRGKIVGFLCAAGGQSSYMSVIGFANHLMLDFRCLIVPRFVYATSADCSAEAVTSPKIQQRIEQLCQETLRLARALKAAA